MSQLSLMVTLCVVAFAYQALAATQARNSILFNGSGSNGGIKPRGDREVEAPVFAGKCLEGTARYSVADQCDAYVECVRGEPTEKLCPDGLMFNDKVRPFAYPCQYPIDVDCGNRSKVQPAEPTHECPHQFGYFRIGDRTNCGKFSNCANGRAFQFDCPEGLAFNSKTYRCDWADKVDDCDAEEYLGFRCPALRFPGFAFAEQRFFTTPNDCQRYFVCLEGRPRLYNCGDGNGFNIVTSGCEAAENVTTCPEYGRVREDKTNFPLTELDLDVEVKKPSKKSRA